MDLRSVDSSSNNISLNNEEFEETTEVIIIGEQLRFRMHENGGDLIKDRRYHLRTYTSCFVGSDAVSWLVKTKEVDGRKMAVRLMRLLQEHNVIHHVCNDHVFQDEMLFFRFRKDDGTFPKYNEARLFYKGRQMFQRLLEEEDMLTKQQILGEVCNHCISGRQLVDWILKTECMTREQTRMDVVKDCQQLIEFRVIQAGSKSNIFEDDITSYYIFPSRLTKERKLSDLKFLVNSRTRYNSDNSQSEMDMRTINSGNGHMCALCDEKSSHIASKTNCSSLNCEEEREKIKSVQLRSVTPEELEDPHSPYAKLNINVFSDSVGYGFVVRGDSPTYVQTVDPQGPAAAAGIKVRQFIMSVNGHSVLRMNHKQVARLVLLGQNSVTLVVMSHFRDASH